MLPRKALSHSLQLLLRSSTCLQLSSGYAVVSLRHWLSAEQDQALPSPASCGPGLGFNQAKQETLGMRYYARQVGRGAHQTSRRGLLSCQIAGGMPDLS